jgi:hypothetical protein
LSNLAHLKRSALMAVTGQRALLTESARPTPRRVLWYYDWKTVGDAVMDLSQRTLVDPSIEIDLCMPHGPLELFEGDARLRRVHRALRDCRGPYDLVITQWITTAVIVAKLRYFPTTPWLSVMCHERDEKFPRMALSFRRLAPLFGPGHPPAPVPPSLGLAPRDAPAPDRLEVVVAVGGRDPRRTYGRWPEFVGALARAWARPGLRLVLMGCGADARAAADAIVRAHPACDIALQLDLPTLSAAARIIERSAAFVGADGGLMHIAAALDKPGVALFCEIRPEWRLHPRSRIVGLFDAVAIDRIAADAACAALLRQLPPEAAGGCRRDDGDDGR